MNHKKITKKLTGYLKKKFPNTTADVNEYNGRITVRATEIKDYHMKVDLIPKKGQENIPAILTRVVTISEYNVIV